MTEYAEGHTKGRIGAWLGGIPLRRHAGVKIAIALVLLVLEVLMFPQPESIVYNAAVGSVWTENDLTAPFPFPVYKEPRQYEKERQDAVRAVPPVFNRRDDVQRDRQAYAAVLLQALRAASDLHKRFDRNSGRLRSEDSLAVARAAAQLPFPVSDADWRLLAASRWFVPAPSPGQGGSTVLPLAGAVGEVYRVGVIDLPRARVTRQNLAVRKGAIEENIPAGAFLDVDEASGLIESRLTAVAGGERLAGLARAIARAVVRPNVLFDRDETRLAAEAAAENVPRTIGYVEENEKIIGKNDRVTDEAKLKLDSYLRVKSESGPAINEWKHRSGIVLQAAIILALFAIYLYLFRKRIFADNGKLTLIALIILMESVFAYLSLEVDLRVPVHYLIFVPAASMLFTIIFDSRVAFQGTVAIALLVAGIRGSDYTVALTSLVAGSMGAYTVRDIRNRTQIFRSMIFILAGYAASMTAFSLEQFEGFRTILAMLAFAVANAVFSPVLTYGLLMLFERSFGVMTDLRLAELADLNHPLLLELSEKAPGTFHHSMTIGTMAEAAAEAVGANPILAKVGAYFHDCGKILKPEYFVENQAGTPNRHSRLRPRMSALIIRAHVKEGMELARANGLPEIVVDFIPQHHGTTRISYFYDKAVKQAARRPGKEIIQEADYEYPGPKPQSKETGIVMLADSVEASTRAMAELTPQRLEQSIDNMIKHRFLEGQLDECELTLRDLTRISDAFLRILLGIHHQRITYPETPDAAAAERALAQAAESPAAESEPPEARPADAAAADAAPRAGAPADAAPAGVAPPAGSAGGAESPEPVPPHDGHGTRRNPDAPPQAAPAGPSAAPDEAGAPAGSTGPGEA